MGHDASFGGREVVVMNVGSRAFYLAQMACGEQLTRLSNQSFTDSTSTNPFGQRSRRLGQAQTPQAAWAVPNAPGLPFRIPHLLVARQATHNMKDLLVGARRPKYTVGGADQKRQYAQDE
jgi:hypothetical protein